MEKGSVAFSYHSKTQCLAFVNIYKYSPFFGDRHLNWGWGEEQAVGDSFSHMQFPFSIARQDILAAFCIQLKPVFLSSRSMQNRVNEVTVCCTYLSSYRDIFGLLSG
jgi:hypothetical protein